MNMQYAAIETRDLSKRYEKVEALRGIDVTPVMQAVVEAAVQKAYGNERRIAWMEIFAGEKATHKYGKDIYLPDETLHAMHDCVVSIKGPLGTPVGGGIRSLNVAIRQALDLYACVRPIRYFPGVSTPVKDSELTDMVVFRENTEDIYAGIEWAAGTPEVHKIIEFLQHEMGVNAIRFPNSSGIGIKPVSKEGSQRLVRKAIQHAIEYDRSSVTLVHKGNIMKYTEGAFRQWGYDVAKDEFGATLLDGGPWMQFKNPRSGRQIVIKDQIADIMFQQMLLRPDEYAVLATPNLNGDYLSDAVAAEVGGVGIAPGANIGDYLAVFEATHGTAPKHAGLDKANPGSLLFSGVMMLEYIGWREAADLIQKAYAKTVASGVVTYDFARQMQNAKEVKTSAFAEAVIRNL